MSDSIPWQPTATPTEVCRIDINVKVVVDPDGQISKVFFDGSEDQKLSIRMPQHLSVLVLHLETEGSEEKARFATHPIQFKDGDGLPIHQPPAITVQRQSDFRCTMTVLNTVSEEEHFGFHAVFLHGKNLVGSPDPSVDLEPPPCVGPHCP